MENPEAINVWFVCTIPQINFEKENVFMIVKTSFLRNKSDKEAN